MIIQNSSSQTAQIAQPAPVPVSFVAEIDKASPAPSPIGNAVESSSSAAAQVTPEALKNAVAVINQVMQQSSSSLQFSVDTDTNTPIVRLVDTTTGELIRQIPSEETLAISRSIDASLQRQGLLCKQVA